MRPLCPASFVHLFASLLLLATGGCAGCPLKLSPSRVVVRYGDPVTINCSLLTNQSQPMGWEAPVGGTQMDNVSHSVWFVQRLTDWDITPMCFRRDENRRPQQCISKPTVVLYTFPDSIHISSNAGSDRSMTERTAYNFTCNVPNVAPVVKLTVRLHREDKVIHNRTFNHLGKKPVNQSSAFEFIPSRDDNNATFRCEALLDLEPDGPKLRAVSEPYTITVKYPPSDIAELEDTEVDVGSPVWLKCSSVGNPRPQYVWNYYRSDNVVEENDDGVSRLWIQNATMLNMGSYTCQARNNLGNVSETVKVHVKGARQECPIKISPEKMVIRYQSEGQNVTCEPTTSGSRNIEGEVSWQPQPGIRTDSATLPVDPSIDWDLQPVCMATFTGIGMCQKALQFTLYKTPDSVSLRHVDDLSAVVENQQFRLRCDVTGVAPAQNVTVLWYQGNKTVQSVKKSWQGSLHVTSCLDENVTGCDLSVTRTPMDVSSIITIALDRSDSGTTFWCEAQLDLGPDGPQPPPTMASSPLNLTVYYKPSINTTKLPKVIPVFQGYPEELVCQAEGQPPPKIQWFYSADKVPRVSGEKLLVTEAGFYNCCATNEVDSIFYVVEVISKEDYLPLIAGLVAITVIIISVVFVFVYSIYYKNTKMRHYSLKNPKLNPQNGNVAHNGWETQLPMTKLS